MAVRRYSILAITLLIATAAAADAPTISAELRAKFWRGQAEAIAAQGDAIAAQTKAQQAKAALFAIQAELQKECGAFELALGPDGEPTCQPKPEAPKSAK